MSDPYDQGSRSVADDGTTGDAPGVPDPFTPFGDPAERTETVTPRAAGPGRHAENERTTVVSRADIDAEVTRHAESERTTVVSRADVDAALTRPPTAAPDAGAAGSAPTPAGYWLNGVDRHGYDDAPPAEPPGRGRAYGPGTRRAYDAGPPPAPEADPYPPAGAGYPPAGVDRGGPMRPPPVPQQPVYPGAGADPRRPGDRGPGPDGHGVSVGEMRARIRESQVAPPYKPVPQTGWRKGVYRTTRINLGLSATERHWNELARRLKVNLRGKYVIAVMGVKGGSSKTTATICLGAALSRYRTDKIVAVDANPASGNLAKRVDEPVTLSWRGLIDDRNLQEYTDFRSYLGRQTSTGLEVLSSDVGDQMLNGQNLLSAVKLLQKQYPIALLDCGNQVRDELTYVMLHQLGVDAVVVPSTTRLDGAQGAAETLNWLMTHGFPHLVREAVVVVSNVNRIDASAQVKGLHEDFARSVRAVHDAPFDQHLSDAVAIDFDRLRPDTRQVYIEAAASLVDGFASAADRDAGAAPGWPGAAGGRP